MSVYQLLLSLCFLPRDEQQEDLRDEEKQNS